MGGGAASFWVMPLRFLNQVRQACLGKLFTPYSVSNKFAGIAASDFADTNCPLLHFLRKKLLVAVTI
jgi:hypothetical protein